MQGSISTQANGASADFLTIGAGPHKVTVGCADLAAGATAIIQTSLTNFAPGDVYEHADPIDTAAKAGLTDADTINTDGDGNEVGREFLLHGPAQVRLWVADIGASDPITLQAIKAS